MTPLHQRLKLAIGGHQRRHHIGFGDVDTHDQSLSTNLFLQRFKLHRRDGLGPITVLFHGKDSSEIAIPKNQGYIQSLAPLDPIQATEAQDFIITGAATLHADPWRPTAIASAAYSPDLNRFLR